MHIDYYYYVYPLSNFLPETLNTFLLYLFPLFLSVSLSLSFSLSFIHSFIQPFKLTLALSLFLSCFHSPCHSKFIKYDFFSLKL